MSKKKFSFDVTGREIFASERAIADTLNAKYGVSGDFVTPKFKAAATSTVRHALKNGKPRETAFFVIVEKVRKDDPVEMKVLKRLRGEGVVVASVNTTNVSSKTASKAGSVKTAVAPKTVTKKGATKAAVAKRPAAVVKATVRRAPTNTATSKDI